MLSPAFLLGKNPVVEFNPGMKRHDTDWEKMFTNHLSGKGLVSKMNCLKLDQKECKTFFPKWLCHLNVYHPCMWTLITSSSTLSMVDLLHFSHPNRYIILSHDLNMNFLSVNDVEHVLSCYFTCLGIFFGEVSILECFFF